MLNPDIKDTVFAEVEAAVDTRVNAIIDPKTTFEHEVGALNFLRRAEVSKVQEENTLLAGYTGPVQFDCDCATGKRIDFKACVPIEDRDVSSKKRFEFRNLIFSILGNLSQR